MNTFIRCVTAITIALAGGTAGAQAFPNKPVRIVVPFAPGGNVDINARAIAPGMGEILGQNVIVENRPGAGGMIGAEVVTRSPADGYTLLLGSNSVYSVSPNVYKKPLFHPVRDLSPIVGVSNVPFVLVIHPSVPAKSFKEFIAVVKSRPGVMTMATAGTGTSNHLVGELIQMRTGLRMTGVPYKGSGPALIDLIGGQVDSHVDQLSSSIGYIQSGRIRVLAVTTDKRAPLLPDVPTLSEQGLKGFDATTIVGIFAPAKTPAAVINRLNAAVVDVLKRPDVQKRFQGLGAETLGNSAQQFGDFVKADFERWAQVVKAANISAQ